MRISQLSWAVSEEVSENLASRKKRPKEGPLLLLTLTDELVGDEDRISNHFLVEVEVEGFDHEPNPFIRSPRRIADEAGHLKHTIGLRSTLCYEMYCENCTAATEAGVS